MDIEAIARKVHEAWERPRGCPTPWDNCCPEYKRLTVEWLKVTLDAAVPEMEAQCEALGEALADLLILYYVIHPRGSDIRDASDEELEKRMKWLGPHVFRVGPVLAARKALREWEARG